MHRQELPEIFQNIDKRLLQKFSNYHRENPDVWFAFEAKCHEIYAHGRTKYSGWVIINAIRWEHDLTSTDAFKINNDFIALYVRLMIHHYPEFEDFFEMRQMKASGRKDSAEERRRKRAEP